MPIEPEEEEAEDGDGLEAVVDVDEEDKEVSEMVVRVAEAEVRELEPVCVRRPDLVWVVGFPLPVPKRRLVGTELAPVNVSIPPVLVNTAAARASWSR